ncbi:MAG TPA: hypothetical protein VEO54_21080 [Thermoanaerobaculia bacterium]|nr:hypothetical protein [Thermoanaerobaculia bacterium]
MTDELKERTRALVESLEQGEEHLDYETHLAPYVDGAIGAVEREIVESHVEDCAMCRRELEDLLLHAQRARGGGLKPALRWLALAAAVVVAIGVAVVMRRPEPVPAVVPVVRSSPPPAPAPAPAPPSYANPEWARLVERALTEGRLPEPAIAVAMATGDTVRGSGESSRAELRPSGVVVETARPTLEWQATPGATYDVVVFSGEEEIATSGPLTEPRWTLRQDLPRGRTYVWQVEVTRGQSRTLLPSLPTPPPAFHVLGAQGLAELEEARKRHPEDRLLLAVLAARHGLAAEARRQLSSSPDPRVQRLLQ